MQDLEGRNAVVIGGGSGIGRGIALALADAGANVLVADLERAGAEGVAAELAARRVRGRAEQVDVTDAASLARLADAAYREFGAVHVLSNNAGVMCALGPLSERSEDEWQWVMSVNLHGVVKVVQAFLPRMRAQSGSKHIQNTASMAGLDIHPMGIGVYTASKHACVAYSLMLRLELASEGVEVSVLCPGMVASRLSQTSARNRPTRFGGPMPEPAAPDSQLLSRMMSAEECGRRVVCGIRENRAHIFSHPEARASVVRRHEQLLADFDAAAKWAR
jgi:NAD(P)-dependent dehydrogenase (short-subunit alcohol dehydrogenase family)